MSEEIWKAVPDYPNYEVSNFGNVRNAASKKIIARQVSNAGYYLVHIRTPFHKRKACTVHRLVLNSFIGVNPDMECDHINGNKLDNRLSNLHWVNRYHNMANLNTRTKMKLHSAKNMLGKTGDKHPMSKCVWCVELKQRFGSVSEAARVLKIERTCIRAACHGKVPRAGGYHWEFAGDPSNA